MFRPPELHIGARNIQRSFVHYTRRELKYTGPLAIDNRLLEGAVRWYGEDLRVVCAYGACLMGSWPAASFLTSSAASFESPFTGLGLLSMRRKSLRRIESYHNKECNERSWAELDQ
jgi:hypothetical protein